MISDFPIVIRWWSALFLIGAAAFPLTRLFFHEWFDEGYLFSKAVGLAVIGWLVFVFGMAHIAPFTVGTIYGATFGVFIISMVLSRTFSTQKSIGIGNSRKKILRMVGLELLFLFALTFWSYIKAHEPSIRGLEKFMDYGFMQSILTSRYFPPVDMWYPPYPINYYYFGHLVTAMVTKASMLELSYAFNLMLCTIFAFCLTMSFGIGYQLVVWSHKRYAMAGGLLTAFFVTLAGNMQTLYAFTKGYTGDNVQPFWELLWPLKDFWANVSQGMDIYWYANATRFIPYTIHEFPSYSFVVSDVHGHVLSIPFVLLAIGLLITMFHERFETKVSRVLWGSVGFYGFLCGVLLMTNALDGPIYFGLFVIALVCLSAVFNKAHWKDIGIIIFVVAFGMFITSLPFLAHFKSFVNGLAINCPLSLFAHTKMGPFLFEGVEKCQRSPLWMMTLLWGFFWIASGTWMYVIYRKNSSHHRSLYEVWSTGFTHGEKLLVLFFFFSMALIIFPEFFYFKDIYPQHFRSNTMFKLGYDAFILFSIVSSYGIFSLITREQKRWQRIVYAAILIGPIFLVSIYPLFSVRSYFGALRTYEGVYGLSWLSREHPDDFAGITWLNETVIRKPGETLVEADGDSYTDYERFSAFTGMPTIVGWAVHEWLWRGSYDMVSPRREDVRTIYESTDELETMKLIAAYHVRFVIIGSQEKERYTKLNRQKFTHLGKRVFESNTLEIYEMPALPVSPYEITH